MSLDIDYNGTPVTSVEQGQNVKLMTSGASVGDINIQNKAQTTTKCHVTLVGVSSATINGKTITQSQEFDAPISVTVSNAIINGCTLFNPGTAISTASHSIQTGTPAGSYSGTFTTYGNVTIGPNVSTVYIDTNADDNLIKMSYSRLSVTVS